jgi:hypothetical protein
MPGLNQGAVKIVLSGTIYGSQTWSCGLWAEAVGVSDWTQTQLNDVATALVTPAFGGGTMFTRLNVTAVTLNGLTLYTYPTGNLTAAKVSVKQPLPYTGTGTDGLPSLLACVVSLRSGTPGRSGRGRIYLPCTKALVMDTTGQITTTILSDVANNAKALIDDINATPTPGSESLRVAVASFTTGDMFPIESIHVNSMVDIQHRREDALPIREDVIKTMA